MENTFKHRNTNFNIDYLKEVFDIIKDSKILENNFNDYRKKLNYVKNINYEDTIIAIKMVIAMLEEELVVV